MNTVLVEASTTSPVKSGGKWKVVLANPGQGQSGFYSADVLREFGPVAIPAGTKAWIGHALPENRDPRDQFGKYPTGAYYDEDFDLENYPDGALLAELQVFKKYEQDIEDLAEQGELSLHVEGKTDDQGNVIEMYAARTNSVDLVAYAGLQGSGLRERIYESLRSDPTEPSDHSAQAKEKGKMEKEILEMLASLKTSIDSLATAKATEAKADADAEVQAKAEEIAAAKVDDVLGKYDEQVAAIDAAELLPSMAESLRADARKGVDVTPLIESAKATMQEFKTLSESHETFGKPFLTERATTEDWHVNGLKVTL